MYRFVMLLGALLASPSVFARPSFAEIIPLGHSIVMVSTDIEGGRTGRGSGVVVSKQYVATNCHILANTKGASIAKFRNAYRPIAVKANWRRDLCLLQFDDLPLVPIAMRDSSTLKYEEEVLSLGFPAGANVPQPSFGNVKATYPFDDGLIIRSDATFTLGSSGGALFDADYNLIGITTFKSPGKRGGFYFSLPVEWIKELMAAPDQGYSFKTNDVPFWALPLEQKPYFMKVVIPYQNKEWEALKGIASDWTAQEPTSADAWYFLGVAEEGSGDMKNAKTHLEKAYTLNGRDLEAMVARSRIAYTEKDVMALEKLKSPVNALSEIEGQKITKQLTQLKAAL